ncbi:MAG: rhodanese-like domain-containing protein [Saprospiraceae bacterium]|nr:rhodanese-like domain-containing protein [Saprospiraceae bacterium]
MTAFVLSTALLQGQSNLNVSQLESLLASDKTVQLVDVRTPGEIQQTGKIAGAWEINYAASDFTEKIGRLDRKRPVVLYCASGGRSARAAAQLAQMGFAKVYNYTGGMYEWKTLRKPTVPAGEKPKP